MSRTWCRTTEGLCDRADAHPSTQDRSLRDAIAAAVLMPADVVRARPEVIVRSETFRLRDYESLRPVSALAKCRGAQ